MLAPTPVAWRVIGMVRRCVVELVDDIDGSTATQTVTFSAEGVEYEIDLNDANAERFRATLHRYARHAHRRVEVRQRQPGGGTTRSERRRSSRIRRWARQRGYDIKDNGRIPVEVRDAYGSENGPAQEPPGQLSSGTDR